MKDAIVTGHFELSSGLHTDTYIQCASLLSDVDHFENLCHDIGSMVENKIGEENIDLVISPAMGGVVVGYEVAKYLGLPFMFTERASGSMELRRGFEIPEGSRVLIVEDVVTSGKSAREVLKLVNACGAEVAGLACLVKRYNTAPYFEEVIAIGQISAPIWKASECPLCAKNEAIDTPGSRNLD